MRCPPIKAATERTEQAETYFIYFCKIKSNFTAIACVCSHVHPSGACNQNEFQTLNVPDDSRKTPSLGALRDIHSAYGMVPRPPPYRDAPLLPDHLMTAAHGECQVILVVSQ
jgi:hypothetical protein